ncbi:MAG TPA: non-homologous end-joining DNA ligase, partial [Gemmatimonadales bacterium]|nr:non-homologous end-joining DNA ligase [Gemmatimonadales bacterium]
MPPVKPWRGNVRALRPMLATLAEHSRRDPSFVYEPKYDGIRALASVQPGSVALYSRLGNEKSAQFPEIVEALAAFAKARKAPLVLDGEVVALDAKGEPAGFQQLQGRIHVSTGAPPALSVAFIVFDILRDGDEDLCDLPLADRRARLEQVFARAKANAIWLGEQVRGDGEAMWERAKAQGWEGLIAKRAASPYRAGKRSPDWMKLKLVVTQEFVIGGWTEPRGTRSRFGALMLGVYEGDDLVYVGHTGAGFDGKELDKVHGLLRPLETPECPFRQRPKSNERPHWVQPTLVAEVKFTEWTADDKLRHPTYLGLRDDVEARKVTRERKPPATRTAAAPRAAERASPPRTGRGSPSPTAPSPPSSGQRPRSKARTGETRRPKPFVLSADLSALVDQ